MITALVINFINLFASLLSLAIIVRVLFTWFAPGGELAVYRFLVEVTEPVLAPLRRLMPQGITIDFSPLIALVLIQLINNVILSEVAR